MPDDTSKLAMTEPCPVCGGQRTLSDEIARLQSLKLAQDPSVPAYSHFQEQITRVTAELLRLEANAPRIAELDRQLADKDAAIAEANTHYARASNQAYGAASQYTTPAAWLGAIGAVLLLVGATLGLPWFLWVAVVMALSGAAGLVALGIRSRRDAVDLAHEGEDEVRTLRGEQESLRFERQSLLPTPWSAAMPQRMASPLPTQPPTPPAGVPKALVPVHMTELVDDAYDD